MTPSFFLRAVSLAFVAGVGLHAFDERVWLGRGTYLAILIVAVLAIGAVWCVVGQRLRTACLVLCLAAAVGGVARYDATLGAVGGSVPPLVRAGFSGRVAAVIEGLRGTELELSAVRGPSGEAVADLRLSAVEAGRYRIGDVIAWSCKPSPFRAAFSVSWSCRPDAAPRIVSRSAPWYPPAAMADLRAGLRALAGRLWPDPESAFILGSLTGDVSGLSADVKQDFRGAGLSHILAASGYNVARVAEAAMMLLAVTGVRRRKAAAGGIVCVAFFAGLTGSGASAMRAALMGGLALLAIMLGRRYSARTALPFAAALMLAVDPAALRHDIGFQLSFAAVWGLAVFAGPIADAVKFLPERFGLRQTFAETAAATLATLPLILFHFGSVPLLAVLANLAVLPLIPWIMAAGAAGLIAGAVWLPLGMVLGGVAWLLSRVALSVASYFGALAGVSVRGSPGLPATLAMCVCLVALAWGLARLRAKKNDKIFKLIH